MVEIKNVSIQEWANLTAEQCHQIGKFRIGIYWPSNDDHMHIYDTIPWSERDERISKFTEWCDGVGIKVLAVGEYPEGQTKSVFMDISDYDEDEGEDIFQKYCDMVSYTQWIKNSWDFNQIAEQLFTSDNLEHMISENIGVNTLKSQRQVTDME